MDIVHVRRLTMLGQIKGPGRKSELRGQKSIINNQQLTATITRQNLWWMLE